MIPLDQFQPNKCCKAGDIVSMLRCPRCAQAARAYRSAVVDNQVTQMLPAKRPETYVLQKEDILSTQAERMVANKIKHRAARESHKVGFEPVNLSRNRQKPAVPEKLTLEEKAARIVEGRTKLRRYQDGKVKALDDNPHSFSQEMQAVELPYSSEDVIKQICDYDILGKLGEGAMGVVYRAYSLSLCRYVAIKVINSENEENARAIIRLHNEALFCARLQHPHIVPIYDSGVEGKLHYFAMALIEGETLQKKLDRAKLDEEEFDLPAILRYMVQTARALDYAHKQGVLHRDIKPENLIVDNENNVHVADFGLATSEETNSFSQSSFSIVGTLQYMSPEQASGQRDLLGPYSDVYSLCATFYECMTGQAPIQGKTMLETVSKIHREVPPKPSQNCVNKKRQIPRDLDLICLKGLEKEPTRRYETAGKFAEDIEAFLAGESISARPQSMFERFGRFIVRNRTLTLAIALLGVAFLTIAGAFGVVAFGNVARSREDLTKLDTELARRQADTIIRAIKVNMAEGRPDSARALINSLTQGPDLKVYVARVDRQLAYRDPATLKMVQQKLANETTQLAIKANNPEFQSKVEQLHQFAAPQIRNAPTFKPPVDIAKTRIAAMSDEEWFAAIREGSRGWNGTSFRDQGSDGPRLTVITPIRNSEACKYCHEAGQDSIVGLSDEGRESQYKGVPEDIRSSVRAVVVVEKSQQHLEDTIRANERTLAQVGLATFVVFAAFLSFMLYSFNRYF